MNLPLHPAIVHFPIALFITAFILQRLHVWRPYWICKTTSMCIKKKLNHIFNFRKEVIEKLFNSVHNDENSVPIIQEISP